MNKILKRLLSVVLAVVMVIGLVPLSGVTTVKAATIWSGGNTIYLDLSSFTDAERDSAQFKVIFKNDTTGAYSGETYMTSMGNHIYSSTVPNGEWEYVYIGRYSPVGRWWNNFYNSKDGYQAVPSDGKNCYKPTAYISVSNPWTVYNESGEIPDIDIGSIRNVKATFYDYMTDEEIANGWNTFANSGAGGSAGEQNGARTNWFPFNTLNKAINGKAQGANWTEAMYFGNFYVGSDAGHTNTGTLNNINLITDRNDADFLGNDYFDTQINNSSYLDGTNKVVTGLVANKLENGQLMVADGSMQAPFFDRDFLTNANNNSQKKVLGKVIETRFPLVTRTTSSLGETLSAGRLSGKNAYYSFDSTDGRDNVRFGDDGYSLIYGAGTDHAVWDAKSNFSISNESNGIGFFPFDKNITDGGKTYNNANNFGFGVRYDIDFTLPENGQKNGEDIIFSFSGDDDLWVFVDDVLVLDMGGDHAKATGEINFNKMKSYLAESPVSKGGTTTKETAFPVLFGENGNENFDNTDTSTVHHMTIFYMERGLIESNLKIGFSFDPLPTGLSLNKAVDVTNVNAGLKSTVQTADMFDFNIATSTEGYESCAPVSGVSYIKDWDGRKTETATINEGKILGLADNIYAHDFSRDGSSAFSVGTYFTIEESGVDKNKYTTYWSVTDMDDGSGSIAKTDGTTAKFQLDERLQEGELRAVNYRVDFVNTPKVGTLQLSKAWNGTAPANGKYEFTIKVDLSGGENYAAYPLAFTSTDTSRTDLATTAEGKVSLAAGETITFTGIPAGASYQIEETNPGTDAAWTIDSVTGGATWTTGTYVASGKIELEGNEENSVGETDTVTFTNKDVVTALEPNKIVIDYGKAVTVDVIADDRANGNLSENVNAQVVGFEAYDPNKTKPSKTDYAEANPTYTESANGDYSVTEDGKVQFLLKRFLSEVEKVYCVVKVGSDSNPKYYLNELDIIPATTMYYETDFSDAITYTNGDQEEQKNQTAKDIDENDNLSAKSTWMIKHSDGGDNQQDDGTIGQSSTSYGYDTSYNDDKDYSNGSTSFINVAEEADATQMYAQFSFTGTGFDIISATGTEAGTIKAQIYQGTETTGTPYKTLTVANIGASTLYQIPVLSCEGLDYGTYTVKILVYGAFTNTTISALKRGGEFCFDAVRIYNPINILENTAETDTTDAGIAQSAYKADKEAFEKHFELRDAILSTEEFNSTPDGDDGVIYIDATEKNPTGSSNVATVKDYESAGPNNETYLKPAFQKYEIGGGETVSSVTAIGFALHTDKIPESIQVGAKSVEGRPVSLDVILENPENTEKYNGFTINNLSHTTAQNYSTKDRAIGGLKDVFVTDENGDYVTYVYISNLGYYDAESDNYTGDGILSITDIKVTFAEKSDIHTTSSSAVLAAFQSHLEQGEPIIDEGTEVESLKLYEAKFTKSSIRYTQNATLEVTTSADISEIVVVNENGNKVAINPTYVEDDNGKLWTMKFKPGKIGTRTFTVYGLDAAGSKTNTETVKINAKIR